MHRVLGLLLVVIPVAAAPAHGQNIRGRLLDAGTRAALAGGTVVLLSADSVPLLNVVTNDSGAFRLAVPSAGGYRLLAERIGYRTAASPVIELEARDSLDVEFLISSEAIVLKPLTVVATTARPRGLLGGFYERKERGFGTFISREDIERRQPQYASDLLRTIAGVQVVPGARGRSYVVVRGCVPQLFLDGLRIRGASIDELVNPLDLEGIEVYRSAAEVPAELSGFSSCGVIALWTRRGP